MATNRITPIQLAAGGIAGLIAAIAIAVGSFEGDKPTGYRDPVGIPTVCYGHTGPEVKVGKTLPEEECLNLLHKDIQVHAKGIARCLKRDIPVPMAVAFVSFAYNVGTDKFCSSTVARKFNAGDFKGACAGLSAWVYAKGQKLPGLVRRRAAERAYCEKGLK